LIIIANEDFHIITILKHEGAILLKVNGIVVDPEMRFVSVASDHIFNAEEPK